MVNIIQKWMSVFVTCLLLSGCLGSLWTGANLFYGRHHVFKKTTDIVIAAKVGHAIKLEPMLECPSGHCFEIAVFHGDVLLLGSVDSLEKKQKVTEVSEGIANIRHLYNYIDVTDQMGINANIEDHWITTKIRSQVMANSDIDPDPFKVVSYQQVVYLLGDVLDEQEKLIIDIAKDTDGVKKVVNLIQTYTLTHQPKKAPPTQSFEPRFPQSQPLDATH